MGTGRIVFPSCFIIFLRILFFQCICVDKTKRQSSGKCQLQVYIVIVIHRHVDRWLVMVAALVSVSGSDLNLLKCSD